MHSTAERDYANARGNCTCALHYFALASSSRSHASISGAAASLDDIMAYNQVLSCQQSCPEKQLVVQSKSELTKALTIWMNQSPSQEDRQSLSDCLPRGDGALVRTEAEARLVCSVIDHARNLCGEFNDRSGNYDLHGSIALMQQVGSAEARDTFIQHGLPRLRKLVRERLSNPKVQHALFALKVIGYYRQPEDVELFVTAVHAPLDPDSFWWHTAFYGFTQENPCTQLLVDRLSTPLPTEFIRIVFLDTCNAVAVAGKLKEHPFASPHGIAALESCLSAREEERFSHAVSACTALPFLRSDDRDRLLTLASEHPDTLVRLEAAWVGAKIGKQAGLNALIDFARDARYSARATAYMKELGLESHIPAEVTQPDFVARAEMSDWLAHPNEMGRPPDHLALVDSRELNWPPSRDKRRLWVFRYGYEKRDGGTDEGYCMTGSVTWAMFGQNTLDLTIDDVYGLHCSWELMQAESCEAPKEIDAAAGRKILERYNPT
jgi:hypothetical protein